MEKTEKIEKKLSEVFNKDIYVFLFFTLLSFAIFAASLRNLNFFWDDERFIFLNPNFINSPNWYSFWIPGSKFYETWSMGYTYFWLIEHSPFSSLFLYKSINIILHAFNSFLVYKFIKKIELPYAILVSSIFLVHPLQVESVSWIFQILTIMSYTFFISSLLYLLNYLKTEKKFHIVISFFLFACSLATKSIAMAAPFIFVVFFIAYKKNWKKYLLLAPFLALVFYFFFRYQVGTDELSRINRPDSIHTQQATRDATRDAGTGNKSESAYYDYIYNKKSPDAFTHDSWAVFKQASWHYFSKTLLPINLKFMYPAKSYPIVLVLLPIFFLVILPLFIFWKKNDRLLFIIPAFSISFLAPYSGVMFITFYYWSQVSDRYTYYFLTTIVVALGFLLKYFRRKEIISLVFIYVFFLSLQSFNYADKFNTPKKLYTDILVFKPHPGIYSLLFEQYFLDHDLKNSEAILNEGLKKFPTDQGLKQDQYRLESMKKNLQPN